VQEECETGPITDSSSGAGEKATHTQKIMRKMLGDKYKGEIIIPLSESRRK